MTLEEKVNIIKENKNKKYLYISPRIINGGANLINNYDTLELYQNMDENTSKFAEKAMVDLMSQTDDDMVKDYLNLNLVFCGDFNDLPEGSINFNNFMLNNIDKIVAIYNCLPDLNQKNNLAETKKIYLSLAKLLEIFKENNIEWKIDESINKSGPYIIHNNPTTKFSISYYSKKEKVKTK